MEMRKWLMAAILLPVAVGTACSRTTVMPPARAEQGAGGLLVTGIGRVEVRPDVLVVNLGVSTEADSATAALDAVSRKARAMLQAMTGEGVEERDIRTTSLQVRPQHDDQGQVVGFSATEMFRVRIKDLTTAGAVVAAGIQAAGDDARVQGMSLDVADPEGAAQDARRRAVEDAMTRAQELAETAGIELGPPVSIQEAQQEEFQAFALPVEARYSFAAAEAAALAPRIETGTQPVTVRVEVRFEISEG
jgi:uncharacterized protein YggE